MKVLTRFAWFNHWFERIYKIGVGLKGFDGLVEFVAGLALLISPSLVTIILDATTRELGEHHSRALQFLGEYVGRLDDSLANSSLVFLIVFLISHGVIKLVLVYCLLKEYVRVYPYALAILGAFLVYQLYVLIRVPTIGMGIFTLLDAIIIYLVWREWLDLRARKVA